MKNTKNIQLRIAEVLISIGSQECIRKAQELESNTSPLDSIHLRNLDLTSSNVKELADLLSQENFIWSISFSYNRLLGDEGATILTKKLPQSINEIGLVDCGIGDVGGSELLRWIRCSKNFKMVCIEQNNFSEQLRNEFQKLRSEKPQLTLIY